MKGVEAELDVKYDEYLEDHSNLKVGGTADYYVEIGNKESTISDCSIEEEWLKCIDFCQKEKIPWVVIGAGNNSFFTDEGFRGMVIKIVDDSVYALDKKRMKFGAGVNIGLMISRARRAECYGLEGLVGIPGNLGAAVRGNIGIPNTEIGDFVDHVHLWNVETNRFEDWNNRDCEFEYRASRIKYEGHVVFSAVLTLYDKPYIDIDEQMRARLNKQPKGNTLGSFFTNPDWESGVYAGQLIDECNLKGMSHGAAEVSEVHGNWLMNKGGATATDVVKLAKQVKATVKLQKGIDLEPEVSIFGPEGEQVKI
jgi:UDP-N-acetylenolpyruvoylglucosamine reductase